MLLIGRIDTQGRLQDVQPIATTNIGFLDPAITAVKAWQFQPAMRNGKPAEIAANIGMRFRLEGKKRGELPRPTLGDISIFPADPIGRKTSPEGFPIRRGGDPRLRVEAVLDLTPPAKAERLPVRAEVLSPKGRRISVYDATVSVPASASQVPLTFTAPVGADWEDGIWLVQFSVANAPAGGGQFWLAGNPETFDFRGELSRRASAGTAPAARPPAAAPKPVPTRRK